MLYEGNVDEQHRVHNMWIYFLANGFPGESTSNPVLTTYSGSCLVKTKAEPEDLSYPPDCYLDFLSGWALDLGTNKRQKSEFTYD